MRNAVRKIGYFCSLVPEEIIMAAGLQPVRISGQAESTSAADGHLYHNLCPYIKNVMSGGLEGGLSTLDGVIFARSCDGMRRMYDAWKAYVDSGFSYMLEVPKNKDEDAVQYYTSQLQEFARSLEHAFGVKIAPRDLRKAIKKLNKSRRLLEGIYFFQRTTPLPLKGSELFKLGLALFNEEKNGKEETLRDYHRRVWKVDPHKPNGKKARILISGNVMDRPDLFEIVEAAGAEVPAADLCTGLRHFSRNVDEEITDPYLALARAYLGEPHCSRTASATERAQEIRKLAQTYNIDGVLLTSVKFCDQHLYDAPFIMRDLAEAEIPAIFVENDYTFTSRNQLATRVEGFIETLEGKRS
ncbi:MAG: 2-hydroxyacyl-CoA dehydratase family protein [Dehalococcoidia bacterium]|nr:2-hydroxyacyl-CoA dehydratase family protein [Dehalococcoidia bacterium]MDD5493201.1 2-hydroxyacyl-CoA dehydratase family protein [Dehalococcoidia bacterium]